ncbi:MAG: hypothetical protein H6670_11640 [Anaerolineaceae bacterium]|nr:hypothetical protein [Anaerolineaceae bacterium]
MTTFRTALTRLSDLSVSGINQNADIDAIPDQPGRAQLPLLLVMPIEKNDDRLFHERGAGFEAIGFSNGARSVTYTVTHLLLVAPVGSSKGISAHLPDLIDLIDSYITAFSADATLADALLEPAHIRIEPGVFPFGGSSFYGCAFRHTWQMEVA